jgi:hypothetical protein
VNEVEFEPKTLRGRRLDKAKIARWKKREEMISGETSSSKSASHL